MVLNRKAKAIQRVSGDELTAIMRKLGERGFNIEAYDLTDPQKSALTQWLAGKPWGRIAKEQGIAHQRIRYWLVSDSRFQDAVRDCASQLAVTGRAMLDTAAYGAVEFLHSAIHDDTLPLRDRMTAAIEILRRATYLLPRDLDDEVSDAVRSRLEVR